MNPRLRRLLARVFTTDAPGDSLILNNLARLPPTRNQPGDHVWNRGFDLLLVDRSHRPRYFCKCRPSGDAHFRRAAELHAALSQDPELASSLLPTTVVSDSLVLAEVTEYCAGPTFARFLARRGLTVWHEAIQHILEIATFVSMRATLTLPHDLAPRNRAHTQETVEQRITLLEEAAASRDAIDGALELLGRGGDAPLILQHGDLWPPNLLAHRDGGWRLVDFEAFGRVQVPLFDVFHLLRTSTETFRHPTEPWVHWLFREEPAPARARDLILSYARQHRLTRGQTLAAFAYYSMELPAQLIARGGPATDWQPYIEDLEATARPEYKDLLVRLFQDELPP